MSYCNHGSPVTQSADTAIKRTIKASLTLKATGRAGEDDIGDLSLRNNETGLFSITVALPYLPRECLERGCITATSMHSPQGFKVPSPWPPEACFSFFQARPKP